jgi:heme A synthase
MFRKFALLVLTLVFATGLLATYIRIASAGLGCPQWPGCFGGSISDDMAELLRHAVDARMRVAGGVWTALAHRYLGIAIGIAGLIMLAMVWRLPDYRPRAVGYALSSTFLIVALAGLGFWSEQAGDFPLLWAMQYTLGFALLGLLFAAYRGVSPSMPEMQGCAGWRARAS